ncbi:hypothetical protein KY362_07860 [Candidatus Woesearchaeota archaeon]|nr:hypothetical protein [Candidatus Woesearchaeota archaeon]
MDTKTLDDELWLQVLEDTGDERASKGDSVDQINHDYTGVMALWKKVREYEGHVDADTWASRVTEQATEMMLNGRGQKEAEAYQKWAKKAWQVYELASEALRGPNKL